MNNITLFFGPFFSPLKVKYELNIKNNILFIRYICFLFILIQLTSCQTIGYKYSDTYKNIPHVEHDEGHLLTSIQDTNSNLKTFKGIGKLKLITNKKSMNLRAAFMGTQQGKFRVEIFGFPGQSSARYTNDGRISHVYFPFEDRLYTIDEANPSLEKLLNLPITSYDLSSFLSGKIPIDDYKVDHISKNEPGKGYEIHLTKGCFSDHKKIFIAPKQIQSRKVEVFNLFGSLEYRAELNKIQSIGEYRIPFDIRISDDNGNGLHVLIDRYWTNIPISASSFTLTHPF